MLVDSALSEAALRDAAGRLHAARVTSLAELRAGLEADDALAQELTVAEKAHLTAGGTADTFRCAFSHVLTSVLSTAAAVSSLMLPNVSVLAKQYC